MPLAGVRESHSRDHGSHAPARRQAFADGAGSGLRAGRFKEGPTHGQYRVPRWFGAVGIALGSGVRFEGPVHEENRSCALLAKPARHDASVVEDFALPPLSGSERCNFHAICNDRYRLPSTVLLSKPSTDRWDGPVGDPAVADSIPDCPVHVARPFGDARIEA